MNQTWQSYRLPIGVLEPGSVLIVNGAAVFIPPKPAAARTDPGPRRAPASGLLSARAAAARLGVNRSTLARLVRAGTLASVPKGSRRGYRSADVEALVESGFTLDKPGAALPRKRTRRRSPTKSRGVDASIAERLARF